jgi:Transglutaminase-like superfamily
MVTKGFAPKWTPVGFAQRARVLVRQPSDIAFLMQIGWFMWRAPSILRRRHLRAFLEHLRTLPRPPAANARTSFERILRLRRLWLVFPFMRSRDNCYVRALTLYRFMDTGKDPLQIHLGIEERDDPRERLRGHAWVTVDGHIFERPPEVDNARIREVPLTIGNAPQ